MVPGCGTASSWRCEVEIVAGESAGGMTAVESSGAAFFLQRWGEGGERSVVFISALGRRGSRGKRPRLAHGLGRHSDI